MKKLVFALMFLSLNSYAELASYSNEYIVDESVERLSSEEMEALKSEKNLGCHAFTACPNGGQIWCKTWGAGCTWFTQPYSYVYCTGFDFTGRWVNVNYTCF